MEHLFWRKTQYILLKSFTWLKWMVVNVNFTGTAFSQNLKPLISTNFAYFKNCFTFKVTFSSHQPSGYNKWMEEILPSGQLVSCLPDCFRRGAHHTTGVITPVRTEAWEAVWTLSQYVKSYLFLKGKKTLSIPLLLYFRLFPTVSLIRV